MRWHLQGCNRKDGRVMLQDRKPVCFRHLFPVEQYCFGLWLASPISDQPLFKRNISALFLLLSKIFLLGKSSKIKTYVMTGSSKKKVFKKKKITKGTTALLHNGLLCWLELPISQTKAHLTSAYFQLNICPYSYYIIENKVTSESHAS